MWRRPSACVTGPGAGTRGSSFSVEGKGDASTEEGNSGVCGGGGGAHVGRGGDGVEVSSRRACRHSGGTAYDGWSFSRASVAAAGRRRPPPPPSNEGGRGLSKGEVSEVSQGPARQTAPRLSPSASREVCLPSTSASGGGGDLSRAGGGGGIVWLGASRVAVEGKVAADGGSGEPLDEAFVDWLHHEPPAETGRSADDFALKTEAKAKAETDSPPPSSARETRFFSAMAVGDTNNFWRRSGAAVAVEDSGSLNSPQGERALPQRGLGLFSAAVSLAALCRKAQDAKAAFRDWLLPSFKWVADFGWPSLRGESEERREEASQSPEGEAEPASSGILAALEDPSQLGFGGGGGGSVVVESFSFEGRGVLSVRGGDGGRCLGGGGGGGAVTFLWLPLKALAFRSFIRGVPFFTEGLSSLASSEEGDADASSGAADFQRRDAVVFEQKEAALSELGALFNDPSEKAALLAGSSPLSPSAAFFDGKRKGLFGFYADGVDLRRASFASAFSGNLVVEGGGADSSSLCGRLRLPLGESGFPGGVASGTACPAGRFGWDCAVCPLGFYAIEDEGGKGCKVCKNKPGWGARYSQRGVGAQGPECPYVCIAGLAHSSVNPFCRPPLWLLLDRLRSPSLAALALLAALLAAALFLSSRRRGRCLESLLQPLWQLLRGGGEGGVAAASALGGLGGFSMAQSSSPWPFSGTPTPSSLTAATSPTASSAAAFRPPLSAANVAATAASRGGALSSGFAGSAASAPLLSSGSLCFGGCERALRLASPDLRLEDVPFHVQRIYLFGRNSPESPWGMSGAPPALLRGLVDSTRFRAFAEAVNAACAWGTRTSRLLSALSLLYPSLGLLMLQRQRRLRALALRRLCDAVNSGGGAEGGGDEAESASAWEGEGFFGKGNFFRLICALGGVFRGAKSRGSRRPSPLETPSSFWRSIRAREISLGLKFGADEDCTLGYLDVLDLDRTILDCGLETQFPALFLAKGDGRTVPFALQRSTLWGRPQKNRPFFSDSLLQSQEASADALEAAIQLSLPSPRAWAFLAGFFNNAAQLFTLEDLELVRRFAQRQEFLRPPNKKGFSSSASSSGDGAPPEAHETLAQTADFGALLRRCGVCGFLQLPRETRRGKDCASRRAGAEGFGDASLALRQAARLFEGVRFLSDRLLAPQGLAASVRLFSVSGLFLCESGTNFSRRCCSARDTEGALPASASRGAAGSSRGAGRLEERSLHTPNAAKAVFSGRSLLRRVGSSPTFVLQALRGRGSAGTKREKAPDDRLSEALFKVNSRERKASSPAFGVFEFPRGGGALSLAEEGRLLATDVSRSRLSSSQPNSTESSLCSPCFQPELEGEVVESAFTEAPAGGRRRAPRVATLTEAVLGLVVEEVTSEEAQTQTLQREEQVGARPVSAAEGTDRTLGFRGKAAGKSASGTPPNQTSLRCAAALPLTSPFHVAASSVAESSSHLPLPASSASAVGVLQGGPASGRGRNPRIHSRLATATTPSLTESFAQAQGARGKGSSLRSGFFDDPVFASSDAPLKQRADASFALDGDSDAQEESPLRREWKLRESAAASGFPSPAAALDSQDLRIAVEALQKSALAKLGGGGAAEDGAVGAAAQSLSASEAEETSSSESRRESAAEGLSVSGGGTGLRDEGRERGAVSTTGKKRATRRRLLSEDSVAHDAFPETPSNGREKSGGTLGCLRTLWWRLLFQRPSTELTR